MQTLWRKRWRAAATLIRWGHLAPTPLLLYDAPLSLIPHAGKHERAQLRSASSEAACFTCCTAPAFQLTQGCCAPRPHNTGTPTYPRNSTNSRRQQYTLCILSPSPHTLVLSSLRRLLYHASPTTTAAPTRTAAPMTTSVLVKGCPLAASDC